MEVVLADVEGRESRSSEDGDAARGILSYDSSDMLAACVCSLIAEGAIVCGSLEAGKERWCGCYVFRLFPALSSCRSSRAA